MTLLLAVLAAAGLRAAAPDTTAFRQGVSYRIEARLDDSAQVLHGRARLRYANHAPVALDTLYVHQYLNAFRPNSLWAKREAEFGEFRFQNLGPGEWGYERFTRVAVAGQRIEPVYPLSPDSTVAAIPLPSPLEPGDSVVVDMDWDARPSVVPRRQGRRGRHYDFAQWYPRIAAYDRHGWEWHPLLPQGEFYGEFASWDVTLDVAADQVIGATGVPANGDPGWAAAAVADPAGDTVAEAADAYPAPEPESLGLLASSAADGRKRVRWRAEDVHHFAWSADPAYIYEAGTAARTGPGGSGSILIHVLYQPGDTSWAGGKALDRSRTALDWLQGVLGPYPYPQITNVHRIERGATEFPMLVMNGGASQGTITHEFAHQWMMGILASNEWKEAWLDEGFASFLTNWFWEEHDRPDIWLRSLRDLAEREAAGRTQPVDTPAADFVDFSTYNAMSYTKGSVVLYMLRQLIGEDAFRKGLLRYSLDNRFRHVEEEDLRHAMERASGQDLGWFFHEWLHTTAQLDYGIGDAVIVHLPDGRWLTRVEVLRQGGAWMPVTLQVNDVRRHSGFPRHPPVDRRRHPRPAAPRHARSGPRPPRRRPQQQHARAERPPDADSHRHRRLTGGRRPPPLTRAGGAAARW